MPKNHIRVIKVPLQHVPGPKAPTYQRMPRLYLELIENKDKIRQDVVNTEFISDMSKFPEHYHPPAISHQPYQSAPPQLQPPPPPQNHHQQNHHQQKPPTHKDKHRKYSDSSASNYYDASSSDSDASTNTPGSLNRLKKTPGSSPSISDSSSDSDNSNTKSLNSSKSYSDSDTDTESDAHHSVDVSNRLKELLDDHSDARSEISQSSGEHFSGSRTQPQQSMGMQPPQQSMGMQPQQQSMGMQPQQSMGMQPPGNDQQIFGQTEQMAPPPLSELRGSYDQREQMVDAGRYEADHQDEEDKKREMLFKFDLLKKSYKEAPVPDFTIHTDYKTMQQTYDNTLKSLAVDNTVESYKTYLIGGFMGVEYLLGAFFKFDMKGFTQHQIMNMSNYERVLIELGEKSYVPTDSDWPGEGRLIIMVLIQAAVFVLGKVIMSKTGSNVLSMFNSLGSMGGGGAAGASTGGGGSSAAPKRKMKGPEINLDDIPDS